MIPRNEGFVQSKFRNTQNNVLKLAGLFFETSFTNEYRDPLYTLRDVDKLVYKNGELIKTYPSLYRLYMEAEDIMEYDFANQWLESYEHWERLCACKWFNDPRYLPRWRRNLELKLKTKAYKAIKKEAYGGGKGAFQAAKFILDKGSNPSTKKKDRVSAEEIISNDQVALTDQDFERIFNETKAPESVN